MKLTDVEVARTIPAPAEQVFDVWIDPRSPGGQSPRILAARRPKKVDSGRFTFYIL
jgi:hypothetical protein